MKMLDDVTLEVAKQQYEKFDGKEKRLTEFLTQNFKQVFLRRKDRATQQKELDTFNLDTRLTIKNLSEWSAYYYEHELYPNATIVVVANVEIDTYMFRVELERSENAQNMRQNAYYKAINIIVIYYRYSGKVTKYALNDVDRFISILTSRWEHDLQLCEVVNDPDPEKKTFNYFLAYEYFGNKVDFEEEELNNHEDDLEEEDFEEEDEDEEDEDNE